MYIPIKTQEEAQPTDRAWEAVLLFLDKIGYDKPDVTVTTRNHDYEIIEIQPQTKNFTSEQKQKIFKKFPNAQIKEVV